MLSSPILTGKIDVFHVFFFFLKKGNKTYRKYSRIQEAVMQQQTVNETESQEGNERRI